MPGRHRKRATPASASIAVGASTVTAVLLGGATSAAPPTVAAPTPVALVAFTADAQTEWWPTDVPRRPAVGPAPAEQVTGRHRSVEKAAAERPPSTPAPAAAEVSCSGSWLSGVKRVAKSAGCGLANKFDIDDIGGYRVGSKEHGSGKALDLMTFGDITKGNAIAEYLLANKKALGVQHVIWRQRINYGSGWKGMPDRGSATANHMDHVHVLFK